MSATHSSTEKLLSLLRQVSDEITVLGVAAVSAVRKNVTVDGTVEGHLDNTKIEKQQHAVHGLAWYATTIESIRQLSSYAEKLAAEGNFGALEQKLVQVAAGEYLAQLYGGVKLSQLESIRPEELGIDNKTLRKSGNAKAVKSLIAANSATVRAEIAEMIRHSPFGIGTVGHSGLGEDAEAMRANMERFCLDKVTPHAHQWHLNNEYIPMEVIKDLAEMGVFGLTMPVEHGGSGLPKEMMCVVTEALSRGYIGVGSLGTRTEIAAELIIGSGTAEQKAQLLPKIANGEIIPTAVFTEPNAGSDLASLQTRAVLKDDVYHVTGSKTFITHPVRADLMTLLVRTGDQPGHNGISMLLAEKPRGTDADPFPVKGMSGSEIEVLGYRGMKEYSVGFDGFEVPASALLGGKEGGGFKQLMVTFEAARIQTAARAIGLAQASFDNALRYALERKQFGKPLYEFPRVSDSIVFMATETLAARQLTYHAAYMKDSGVRCDYEAGMAKLLGARVAMACADNALQIHGGMGFAQETPISRIWCDARVLSIFEGAAEIQANIIGKALLENPSRMARTGGQRPPTAAPRLT